MSGSDVMAITRNITLFARSANCKVLTVSAACRAVGAMHASTIVRVLPPNESCSNRVSLESR